MASKRMMIIAVLVAAVVVVAALAVAIGTWNKSNNASSTVVDALDRSISTNATPKRIVSCAPAITEIVFALGSGASLVAVTDYCDYPSQVQQRKENGTLESIGAYKNPSFDMVVEMRSDMVILIEDAEGHTDLAAKLDEAHIPNIVIFECTNLTKIYSNMMLLGEVLHAKAAAKACVDEVETKVQYIQSHVSNSSRPRVMFAVWLPFWVAGGQTYIDDVMQVAGGINAFANVSGYNSVANEAVTQENPDVIIITATMMATAERTAQQIREDIMSIPELKYSSAVTSGKVFVLMNESEDIFLRPGLRITDGAGLIARMLSPESFGGSIPNVIDGPYQSYLPSYN
jgi:iron complex transport system substrate-binding protein